ncbi:hypothetical protein [Microbacterium hydrocarbonoxydans]|uniref:hypothetical protein n=1 Tax=Microbacterium hydrocarbonoxydans TaxID=273678 RepID=UPI0007BB0E49|nr:hypothetical protein [Microbacterium hydrocarbonoxydans]GAT74258.1 SusC/RagA family TonB-linked outer membrane protein [Microbacterium sp. HM58-2]
MSTLHVENLGSVELLRTHRTLGISPGDVASVIEDEARRIIEEADGSRQRAIGLGIRRMRARGLITDADVKRLEQASRTVFLVGAGKQPPEEGAATLDTIYRESLDDPEASEMGSTMVGATYAARNSSVAPAAGLFGMLIGGLLTGGSGGMLIGGLIGWGVGKVCGDEEE